MKGVSVVVFIFFAIYFTASDGLECYMCLYYEGSEKYDDPSCKENPGSDLAGSCDPDSPMNLLLSIDADASKEVMCASGTAKYKGKDLVIRGCVNAPSEFDDTCEDIPDVPIPPLIQDVADTADMNVCFCSKDQCNNKSNDKNYFNAFAGHLLSKLM